MVRDKQLPALACRKLRAVAALRIRPAEVLRRPLVALHRRLAAVQRRRPVAVLYRQLAGVQHRQPAALPRRRVGTRLRQAADEQ